jgi:Bax protein
MTILALLLPVVAAGALLLHYPTPNGATGPQPRGLFAPPSAGQARHLPGGALELTTPSVVHLKAAFDRMGYRWQDVDSTVPRVRLSAFPADLGEASGRIERKRLFYQTMMPLILMENERVRKERRWLTDILARHDAGQSVSAVEAAWVEALADRYGARGDAFSAAGRDDLLQRVDGIPPSLALAMAALESGWGTSRFAGQGNNVFGHWTFRPGTGLVPRDRPAGASYELAVFPDLATSFRAFLHNLNTHWAYEDFRSLRARIEHPDSPGGAIRLARSLLRYSTRGEAYCADLVRVMRRNNLFRFDGATLHAPATALRAERAPTPDKALS